MNPRGLPLCSFICAIAIAMMPHAAQAGGLTAKSSLPKTLPAAKKWNSDAVLVGISSLEVNGDGTAKWWIHAFYSPSTKRYMNITVKPGSMDTTEVGRGSTKPIGDDFVDSDKAMELAKKSGLKGENPMMGLKVLGTGSTAYWTVTGGYTTGDVSVVLEAKTGKLLSSEVIKGF